MPKGGVRLVRKRVAGPRPASRIGWMALTLAVVNLVGGNYEPAISPRACDPERGSSICAIRAMPLVVR